jgi:hypothetical protein
MSNDNSPTPRIPAQYRDAAAEAQAAEEARRHALWERADRDRRCQEAVWAFRHETNALWSAPPDEARSFLARVYATLLKAVQALADVGRLGDWERTDHERTYDRFRVRNDRVMSPPTYDWAREMFDLASKGELPEDLLVQTWDEKSLRDVLRWLSVFVEGLSGEGAKWLRKMQEPPTPQPARTLSDRDPPEELMQEPPTPQPARTLSDRDPQEELWMPASEAVQRAEKAGLKVSLSWLSRFGEKWGVKMRPRTLPGKHKLEAELNSLAGCLVRRASGKGPTGEDDEEPCEGQFDEEIAKAIWAKQRGRSSD